MYELIKIDRYEAQSVFGGRSKDLEEAVEKIANDLGFLLGKIWKAIKGMKKPKAYA